MTMEDIENTNNFVNNTAKKHSDIKVIGVGGGGGNAVNYMYDLGIEDVSFVICNTDLQHLNSSPVPTRLLIGPTTTKGQGAGNKPEVAAMAAEESAADIDALFDDGTKMVFITAGMGGGTGTGAAPVIARIAKERGLLTIGIVTIPFTFERQKKILKALKGADEMGKYVDALMVINNERLIEIYKDYNFLNAFHKADETLAIAARSISELITKQGHINLDFHDVDSTLRNGGAAIISTGYGEGENRVQKAIDDALRSPLLKDTDIFTSKRFLFNIYFDPNAEQEFMMSEAEQLTAFMSNLDENVDAIWGVALDETLGNKVKISILAAGFKVSLHNQENTEALSGTTEGMIKEDPAAAEQPKPEDKERLRQVYGEEKFTAMERNKEMQRYIILTPDQMDDEAILDIIERTPVFRRDRKVADEIKASMADREKINSVSAPAHHSSSNPQAGTRVSFGAMPDSEA